MAARVSVAVEEEIPLPDAPPEEDPWPEDEPPADEFEAAGTRPPVGEPTADERARWARVHDAARARSRGLRRGSFVRFSEVQGPDPLGRHVGCDGELAPGGVRVGGCRVAPGEACRHPSGRYVLGYVHPSRLAAEAALFGVAVSTLSV